MKNNISQWIFNGCLGVLLIGVTLTTQGCFPLLVGAAAGAGGVSYVKGITEKNVDYSVKKVHKATLKALKKLKYFISSDEESRHLAVVKAEFKDGKKFTVEIKALTERASKIIVKTGVLGSEEKSRMVLNAIEKKL